MSIKEMASLYPIRFLSIILIVVGSAIGTTSGNYLLTFGINELKTGNLAQFALFMRLFGGLLLFGFLTSVLSKQLYLKLIQTYLHTLRENYVQRLYDFNLDASVSKNQNRLTNDLKIVESDFAFSLLDILMQSLALIMSAVALLTFHWSLLVLILVLSIIMMFIPALIAKPYQRVTSLVSKSNSSYLKAIEQWLGGMAELKHYGAKQQLLHVMSSSSYNLENSRVKRGKIASLINLINLVMNILRN
ncbi:ABC transporter transmembrane domain-containing protein [Apilactobacillus xinyiensis]|uniref:ABC transporter transmembrane domain-containing protein n=1 Tax=Apilactobacillus xinyiensis TaxID=2841032 RepID=UPI001C7E1951|nr:ABC transporter transmembrane domain-containing protein [Apilactobacillus xinyiensis]